MFFGFLALRNLWVHAWNSLYTRNRIIMHEITMVTTCIGLLNTGYNNNAWNYNGYNMCRVIEYSSDVPWNWFIETCEFQVMSNYVGHSFWVIALLEKIELVLVLGKIWETFQFHVKYVGSILTFSRTLAVRMCDCSLTLHPGFSLTIAPGPIIMGCLFLPQTVWVVYCCWVAIDHLL